MSSLTCLALAIFLEAGIEPPKGMEAVGWVVINSSNTLYTKPKSICKEVYSGRYIGVNKQPNPSIYKNKTWKKSYNIAKQILQNKIPDPTNGATHFECTLWKSCRKPPKWAKTMEYKGHFGSQNFWKAT